MLTSPIKVDEPKQEKILAPKLPIVAHTNIPAIEPQKPISSVQPIIVLDIVLPYSHPIETHTV